MMRNVSLVLLLCCVVLIPMAAAETVGWRGDGSGRFPEADPPTEWGKDQHIVWKTEMPNWSNSSPIIVGGKLFVGCEPSDLICCDVNDGKILWRKSQDYFDAHAHGSGFCRSTAAAGGSAARLSCAATSCWYTWPAPARCSWATGCTFAD